MRWLLALALVVIAGCGGSQQSQKTVVPAVETTCVAGINCEGEDRPPPRCGYVSHGFRTCTDFAGPRSRSTIEHKTDKGWVVLEAPMKPADPSAHWGEIWLSPDGRTLLAEWRFPCDSTVAVFVPAEGGTPRVVTGQRDWTKAPISRPLGWTRTGLARVGVSGKRGVQLIDPDNVRRVRVPRQAC